VTFTLQPTQVATINDEDGMLVFFDGRLVAVLVRLSDKNEVAPGDWYLEAGFGRGLDGRPTPPSRPSMRRRAGSQST
jgi:hypothetical protein